MRLVYVLVTGNVWCIKDTASRLHWSDHQAGVCTGYRQRLVHQRHSLKAALVGSLGCLMCWLQAASGEANLHPLAG